MSETYTISEDGLTIDKTESVSSAITYSEEYVDARIAQCKEELAYWEDLKTKF